MVDEQAGTYRGAKTSGALKDSGHMPVDENPGTVRCN